MMVVKATKKPKYIEVRRQVIEAYITSYQCPSCKVIFEGGGPARNVVRFRCSCGQELIVREDDGSKS
jgi:predicted RNA-binding Zn-ribbon protein involved in translation (DUF1610 family)